MASACAWSVALVGLGGRIVEVEADIGAGLPHTVVVGLPDSACSQARDRCKSAVSNSGQDWPISLLTINLSPATLPKAAAITMSRSSQPSWQLGDSSELRSYAEQSCWASLAWTVVSDRYVGFCPPSGSSASRFQTRNRPLASGRRGEPRRSQNSWMIGLAVRQERVHRVDQVLSEVGVISGSVPDSHAPGAPNGIAACPEAATRRREGEPAI